MTEVSTFEEITRDRILAATELVRRFVPPSSLEKIGPVWTKFESENVTGAFKVRGGLVYCDWLKTHHPEVNSVITATRGNHGQSIAFAARKSGIQCIIVVPSGNSPCKNQAMRELGATLVEQGRDFADAMAFAMTEAKRSGAHFVPSFDWKLVLGVSTYGFEMFRERPELDAVFVPIGLGSGICGTIAARDALELDTRIVGVVAERAPCYADSFLSGKVVEGTGIPDTIADGVACRIPVDDAFDVIKKNADRIVQISEPEIREAIREIHEKTGRRSEGAGAIAYAAWKKHGTDCEHAAFIHTGGNIDEDLFEEIING